MESEVKVVGTYSEDRQSSSLSLTPNGKDITRDRAED